MPVPIDAGIRRNRSILSSNQGIQALFGKHYDIIPFPDNGCRISLEAQKHIFDKFYPEDTSLMRPKEWSGISFGEKNRRAIER